jgi:hypothetical protein
MEYCLQMILSSYNEGYQGYGHIGMGHHVFLVDAYRPYSG